MCPLSTTTIATIRPPNWRRYHVQAIPVWSLSWNSKKMVVLLYIKIACFINYLINVFVISGSICSTRLFKSKTAYIRLFKRCMHVRGWFMQRFRCKVIINFRFGVIHFYINFYLLLILFCQTNGCHSNINFNKLRILHIIL